MVALLASACSPVGPDFQRPALPWLDGWQPEASATAAPPAATVQADLWWQVFNDPALDQVVAEAQRSNPSVAIAGARIMEARAQLGIAGSGLYPQLQQLSGQALRVGQDTSNGPSSSFAYGTTFDIAGKWTWGIPATSGSGCELAATSRSSTCGAGRGAGRQSRLHPDRRAAPAHRTRERGPAEAQPRDHRKAVRERQ
jgi:hypothetical protein